MWWANLTPFAFMPVLVLMTRVIHRSTLHFAVARNIIHKSNTWEKTWQVESVEHKEQYHKKIVETSLYFKFFFKLRRIMCTLLLCNKNYRLRCLFIRKLAFIPLLSLAWGKFFRCVSAHAHLRALMTRKSCALGMHNATLRNHLKLFFAILMRLCCPLYRILS